MNEVAVPRRIYQIVPSRQAVERIVPDLVEIETESDAASAVIAGAVVAIGLGLIVWWYWPVALALLKEHTATSWAITAAEVAPIEAVRWHLEEVAFAAVALAGVAAAGAKIADSADSLKEKHEALSEAKRR